MTRLGWDVTVVTPTRGAVLQGEEPNRLESLMDASDVCTRVQRVADESREPTDDLERVRRSQNGCKRLNLPAKSLKTHPEEPKRPGNRADAHMCRAVESTRKRLQE